MYLHATLYTIEIFSKFKIEYLITETKFCAKRLP